MPLLWGVGFPVLEGDTEQLKWLIQGHPGKRWCQASNPDLPNFKICDLSVCFYSKLSPWRGGARGAGAYTGGKPGRGRKERGRPSVPPPPQSSPAPPGGLAHSREELGAGALSPAWPAGHKTAASLEHMLRGLLSDEARPQSLCQTDPPKSPNSSGLRPEGDWGLRVQGSGGWYGMWTRSWRGSPRI